MNPTPVLSGLGSAITANPSLGAAATGTPGAADLFLALVEGMLAQTDPEATPDGKTAGDEALAGLPDEGGQPDTAPLPDSSSGLAATGSPDTPVLAALAGLIAPAVVASAPAVTSAGSPEGSGSESGAKPTAPGLPAATAAVPQASGQADGQTSGQAGAGPGSGQPAQSTIAATAAAADTAPAEQSLEPASGPATAARGAEPIASTSGTNAAPVAAVTGPATTTAVAPTAPVTAPAAADPHGVIDQVFAQVVQSAGRSQQGTQRLTVRLNPENLGEVRVVLTQRHGELQVTLAAGDQARASLLEGSHELRRLLESVGHTDSRIVVRDPAAPAQTASVTAPTGRSDLSGDTAGWADGTGSAWSEEAPEQRDSRSPHSGSNNATDGTTVSTNPSRRPDDAGRTHSGLDLSM